MRAIIGAGIIAAAAAGYMMFPQHLHEAMPTAITPGAVISENAAIACAKRPRLYDTDEAAYRRQAKEVFARYSVPWSDHHNWELDHLIPRCLGGADTSDNLWPQPLEEAKRKDVTERELCKRACTRHDISVPAAQRVFIERRW